jgi:hypothetical protein
MARGFVSLALPILVGALALGCGVTPEGTTGPRPPMGPDVPAQQPMTTSDAGVEVPSPGLDAMARPDTAPADAGSDVKIVDAAPDVPPQPPPPPGWTGGPLIVGVGIGGRHIVSRDGITWSGDAQDVKGTADPSKNFQAVAYGGGLVVAVGGGCVGTTCSGRISTFDGTTWTTITPPAPQPLSGVAYGQGTWVAVGAAGLTLYSADGKHWTAGKTALPTNVRAVAWGLVGESSMFIAVGDNSLRARSTDGQSWTNIWQGFPSEDAPGALVTVAIGDKVAVAGGDKGRRIRTITGTDWDNMAGGGVQIPSLVYADHMFIGYAVDNNAWVSTNAGVSWEVVVIVGGPRQTYAAGVLGGSRLYVGAADAVIKTSSDGRGWTQRRFAAADENPFTAFTFAGY